MYTVARHVQIPVPSARVWQCLTEPAALALWFADTEHFEPGRSFRLEFGDGDFFAGTIKKWDEPNSLQLEWKFMGLGARYDVEFALTSLPGPVTELTVVDRGCLTLDEMNALGEGWSDFLARLARCAQSGEPARFGWSEALGLGALLPGRTELPSVLRSPEWWQSAFPDAHVSLREPRDGVLCAGFHSLAWGDVQTEAQITLERVPAGACLSVLHQGWPHLPEGMGRSERRLYAQRWQAALEALEQCAGGAPEAPRAAIGERSPAAVTR